jgi:hypothetical protein
MRRTKRTAIAAGGALAAAAAPVAVALAAKPPSNNQLTLSSSAPIITFGQRDTLSGQLKGAGNTGVKVQLQEQPAPFSGTFKNVAGAAATTDNSGHFSFTVQPGVSTKYRAVAKAGPQVMSPELTLPVRFKVTLRLSDYTPRAGQRVRFSGSCAPANNGAIVYIQRRTASGRFRTVSRTVLRSAATNLSTYSKRIRIRASGVFRARVLHTDKNATGTSRAKHARVH